MDIASFRRILQHRLVEHADLVGPLPPGQLVPVLRELTTRLAAEQVLPEGSLEPLYGELAHLVMTFGPLWRPFFDVNVSEIMVNGPNRVFVERNGQMAQEDIAFRSEDDLRHTIDRLLDLDRVVRLDVSKPWCDLTLPDGSRANIVIPPIVSVPHVTIRKYQGVMRTVDDLVAVGTLDEGMGRLLVAATVGRLNLLFSGAAGSGKTTLLEILSRVIPVQERIVCIEDTMEVHIDHPNVVRMLTRNPNLEGRGEVTIGDLFRNALRMAPDRVLLGEIRGREAYDYLQALNSGHQGSLAVLHASSPEEAVIRLQNLVPLAGLGVPPAVVKRQISHGLDLIVQVEQLSDGSRKVTRITEVGGLGADGEVMLTDLFAFATERTNPLVVEGHFEALGNVPSFLPRLERSGHAVNPALFTAPRP